MDKRVRCAGPCAAIAYYDKEKFEQPEGWRWVARKNFDGPHLVVEFDPNSPFQPAGETVEQELRCAACANLVEPLP